MIDFKGLDSALKLLGIFMLIAIPLAVWKAVELVVWIFKHISISFN